MAIQRVAKTISLDNNLAKSLERLAEARRESASYIVREALRAHLRRELELGASQ